MKSELIARLREADEVDRELAAAGVDGYEGLAAAITAAAADDAAAAATAKAAAAAASAAASPIATASYALPPIILDGRFKGYMSPRHVMELKLQIGKYYDMQSQHDFDRWQDDVTDGLPVQFMRRHMLLTAIRSKRTGVPSEPAATAAAAAADDTSAAAAAAATATAAAAAATNAAATTIARLEHELGEMAAAAAAATAATAATTNAAATAAAEEIARLQHELGERTHWLRTAPTPMAFYPERRDWWEADRWAAWCNSTQWGTNITESSQTGPAPTPNQQACHTVNRTRREHQLHGHLASGSAQLSVPVPAT